MVTARGTNTIYALAYAHASQDPWRRDSLLEQVLASFELDAWSALERGDYATAINVLLPAAELGHRLARAWLGHLHEHGLGVQQDDDEALRWYHLAVDQGCEFSREAAERLTGSREVVSDMQSVGRPARRLRRGSRDEPTGAGPDLRQRRHELRSHPADL
jgi:hypothetical protein